ncbi:MAG: hypothetical protein ACR2OZ_11985 [Verrucomicrobiales bacterium]
MPTGKSDSYVIFFFTADHETAIPPFVIIKRSFGFAGACCALPLLILAVVSQEETGLAVSQLEAQYTAEQAAIDDELWQACRAAWSGGAFARRNAMKAWLRTNRSRLEIQAERAAALDQLLPLADPPVQEPDPAGPGVRLARELRALRAENSDKSPSESRRLLKEWIAANADALEESLEEYAITDGAKENPIDRAIEPLPADPTIPASAKAYSDVCYEIARDAAAAGFFDPQIAGHERRRIFKEAQAKAIAFEQLQSDVQADPTNELIPP